MATVCPADNRFTTQLGAMMSVHDSSSDAVTVGAHRVVSKPKWHTPLLTEDPIGPVTHNVFGPGIDTYEANNPVGYGS